MFLVFLFLTYFRCSLCSFCCSLVLFAVLCVLILVCVLFAVLGVLILVCVVCPISLSFQFRCKSSGVHQSDKECACEINSIESLIGKTLFPRSRKAKQTFIFLFISSFCFNLSSFYVFADRFVLWLSRMLLPVSHGPDGRITMRILKCILRRYDVHRVLTEGKKEFLHIHTPMRLASKYLLKMATAGRKLIPSRGLGRFYKCDSHRAWQSGPESVVGDKSRGEIPVAVMAGFMLC